MTIEYHIRLIANDDILPVFRLGSTCFNWIVEKVNWDIVTVAWYYENHRNLCFVAVHDSNVIGFVLAFVKHDIGYIGWIAVTDNYRNCGIGTDLLKNLITELKKEERVRSIAAHVRRCQPAERLFSKCLFTQSNETKIEMILKI